MKGALFLFIGAVISLGDSCKKNAVGNNSPAEVSTTSANKSKPSNGSGFFDPTGLISPSQHGVLDTIQKGFGFTEGPAVDNRGNVFFTDQPNDKIYRWDASSGAITTFLTGT